MHAHAVKSLLEMVTSLRMEIFVDTTGMQSGILVAIGQHHLHERPFYLGSQFHKIGHFL